MAALMFRSRLEAECSRTIERSITQIQVRNTWNSDRFYNEKN